MVPCQEAQVQKKCYESVLRDHEEPQGEAPVQTSWGPKVYEMVKDMDHIEFTKKKKKVLEKEWTK